MRKIFTDDKGPASCLMLPTCGLTCLILIMAFVLGNVLRLPTGFPNLDGVIFAVVALIVWTSIGWLLGQWFFAADPNSDFLRQGFVWKHFFICMIGESFITLLALLFLILVVFVVWIYMGMQWLFAK